MRVHHESSQSGRGLENAGMAAIGRRLRAVRTSHGYSQIEFAHMLGLSQQGYRNYERGSSDVPVGIVLQLYEKFDVSARWLLTGQGGRNAINMRRVLESAVLQVKEFIGQHGGKMVITREREARMIRVLFEYLVEHERLSPAFQNVLLEEIARGAISSS